MELWQFYRILRRRKWLVLMIWLICIAGVTIFNLAQKRMWVGETTVMERVGRDVPVRIFPQDPYPVAREPEIRLNNLKTIILSETVLRRAMAGAEFPGTVEELRRVLDVEPIRNTEIISIAARMPNPEEAQRLSGSVAAEFQDFYKELNTQQATEDRKFIEEQIPKARATLEAARDKMRDFQQASEISSNPDEESVLSIRTLLDTQASVATAEGQYKAAVTTFKNVERELLQQEPERVSSTTYTENPDYENQLSAVRSLQNTLDALRQIKTEKHPDVINAAMTLQAAKGRLNDIAEEIERQRVVASNPKYDILWERWIGGKTGVDAARKVLDEAQLELARLDARVKALPAKTAEFNKIGLDVATARESFANLSLKLDEAKIKQKQAETQTSIAIIDPASVRPAPNYSILRWVLSAVLGFILAAGTAFLLHYLDNTIRTPEQAEELLGLPVFAVVPAERAHHIALEDSRSALVASYELLSTNLWLNDPAIEKPTFVIASAEPNVGRSTTAANLAASLARDGGRVILVDSDLREPSQHKIFGVSNEKGLVNVLTGETRIEDVLVRTPREGLLLVPSGPLPANPVRLLKSQAMQEFVEKVSSYADFVIFDTPAGVTFADAALIAACAKNVIIVQAAGKVPRGAEDEFRRRLERVNARLIGVVLNRVRREDSHAYYHYQRAYRGVLPRPGEGVFGIGDEMPALTQRDEDNKNKNDKGK
jgi:succinoglycan biosynthesis transport protein ExoP